MKGKVMMVLVILLSIINLQGVPLNMGRNEFNSFSNEIMESSTFCENGLMYEYSSFIKKSDEKNKIIKFLSEKNQIVNIIEKEDEILAETTNGELSIRFFEEKSVTKIEVSIVNYNEKKDLKKIKNELNELKWNKIEGERLYKYQKYKIQDMQKIHNYLQNKIEDVQITDYYNGCFGTGYLEENEKISFVISKYNTGYYLIVGTPTIYISY